MSEITNKLTGLLIYGHHKKIDWAKKLNISKQALSNKLRNETYTLQDVIYLADMLGFEVALINTDKHKSFNDFRKGEYSANVMVSFNINDLKKEK